MPAVDATQEFKATQELTKEQVLSYLKDLSQVTYQLKQITKTVNIDADHKKKS